MPGAMTRGWRQWVLVGVTVVAATGCDGDNDQGTIYFVGAAQRDITPTTANAPPDGQVFLGGYGFGPERRSTGTLAPLRVRAFVVSNGSETVAFAQNETQGAFAAYKTGPFGLADIAAAVEAATDGRIPREHVVVGSDHSHAGPDTTGIWGGLPDSYLQYLKDQTVGAITDAFAAVQPSRLVFGSADASELLRSQFQEPPNDAVDGELRVLVALDAGESADIRAILINFAAHATVMGSGNRLISGDWPGVVAAQVEEALGVDTAVVMMADCGRTQPRREDVPGETDPVRLEGYATAVTGHVFEAVSQIIPASGNRIEAAQLFLRERFNNPFFSAELLSSLVSRRAEPPWQEGDAVGTLVSGVRVGDLFFAAVPGEGYPAIQFELEQRVPASEHFIFGMANDQLGYLISPEDGYQQVLDAAPDNDNAVFNVSPSIGDHVMCTAFKAARAVGFSLPSDPPHCERWADEDNSLPEGAGG